jgi:menaquinone-dependent protoporphyrinogen IX oxidase
MGNKTLIAYSSKGGATMQARAEIIAEVLRDKHRSQVDVVDLRKTTPKLADYANVVGAGVRGEKV